MILKKNNEEEMNFNILNFMDVKKIIQWFQLLVKSEFIQDFFYE